MSIKKAAALAALILLFFCQARLTIAGVEWDIVTPKGWNVDQDRRWAERTSEKSIIIRNNLGSYLEGDQIEYLEPSQTFYLRGHITGCYFSMGMEYHIKADEFVLETPTRFMTLKGALIGWESPDGTVEVTGERISWFENEDKLVCREQVRISLSGREKMVFLSEDIEAYPQQGKIKSTSMTILRKEYPDQWEMQFPGGLAGNIFARHFEASAQSADRPVTFLSRGYTVYSAWLLFDEKKGLEMKEVTIVSGESDGMLKAASVKGNLYPLWFSATGNPVITMTDLFITSREIYWDGEKGMVYFKGNPLIKKTGAQEMLWSADEFIYNTKDRILSSSGKTQIRISDQSRFESE